MIKPDPFNEPSRCCGSRGAVEARTIFRRYCRLGAVWGRGTVDTKASLFVFLPPRRSFLASGFTPACDVYLASSCTEEWSGEGAPPHSEIPVKEQGVHLSMLIDEGGMIIERTYRRGQRVHTL